VLNLDGSITGTPGAPGVYAFSIEAADGSRSATAALSYLIENAGTLALFRPAPECFPVGAIISFTITAG
jgi:hypothetical protein